MVISLNNKKTKKEKKMTIDKTITQDLFGYESVPCLECDGTGEEPNTDLCGWKIML
jgi:hypothetical protein